MVRGRIAALILLSSVCFACPIKAEEAPWNRHDWGSEESSRVLFRPARLILFRDGEIDFIASNLRYTFRSKTGKWEVAPTDGREQHFESWGKVIDAIQTTEGVFEISAPEDGELEIRGKPCGSEPHRLRLWSAADLGRVWLKEMQERMGPRPGSAEELAKRLEVSKPQVLAWNENKRDLWLGIGFYAGEGSAGVGTLVHLNKTTCDIKVNQPPQLGIASIMYMARLGKDLWLATGHFGESGWGTSIGIVRYDIRSGRLESLPKDNPLSNALIFSMGRQGSTLWLATPGRFLALNMHTRALRIWRIVPRLELKEPSPLSSRPGGPERVKLQAGNYEVRWLGPGFAEILTPDCETGFVEKDWLTDPRMKGTADLDEIAASSKWGIPSLLTYSTPVKLKARPTPQGWFLRVSMVRIGSPKGNWQRTSVCAGWVEARPEDVRLSVERMR